MIVRPDDLSGDQIKALLALHLAGMHESSPPGTVFALDLTGLKAPNVTVWSAWEDAILVGCGALKELAPDWGEIKSMRTHPSHMRKGVGTAILTHIVLAARDRGYCRLSLETGTGAAFEPALILYRRHGFANGEPFGDYITTGFNQYLHRCL